VTAARPFLPCRDFVAFLDDYLAGVLPSVQLEGFNDHLARCPPCVVYMKTYRDTIRLGKAALERSEEPTPDDIPETLVQAILAARSG
jgi:anti-sigma factor RsiW